MRGTLSRSPEDTGHRATEAARPSFMKRNGRVLTAAVAVAVGVTAGIVTFLANDSDGEWTRGQLADIARLEGQAEHYANRETEWTRGQRADIARLEGLAEYYEQQRQSQAQE
jgi:hypothetical protein